MGGKHQSNEFMFDFVPVTINNREVFAWIHHANILARRNFTTLLGTLPQSGFVSPFYCKKEIQMNMQNCSTNELLAVACWKEEGVQVVSSSVIRVV